MRAIPRASTLIRQLTENEITERDANEYDWRCSAPTDRAAKLATSTDRLVTPHQAGNRTPRGRRHRRDTDSGNPCTGIAAGERWASSQRP